MTQDCAKIVTENRKGSGTMMDHNINSKREENKAMEKITQQTAEKPACRRLKRLREQMKKYGIDVYLIVSDDFHASEYVGDYFKCREYISGFDGSAGTLVVTVQEAGLWTDGRYFIQAREQLAGTGITLYEIGEKGVPTILQYLQSALRPGQCLGYDAKTVRAGYSAAIKEHLKGKKIKFEETLDLVGLIWEDRPRMKAELVWLLTEEYAGQSRSDKLERLREAMRRENADAFLLSSLDDIAWLYNIRGNDVAYNPVALAYTIVNEKDAVLYIGSGVADQSVEAALAADRVIIRPYLAVYQDVASLKKGMSVMMDENTVNTALREAVCAGVNVINRRNPTTEYKAVKNKVEMENMQEAHRKDGVAVTKLIYWLKKSYGTPEWEKITELSVCEKLEEYRKEGTHYLGQSFAPIAASGAHGAIVHYEPTEKTAIPLVDHSFLLLDTGGQYLEGTTDITRTISIGEIDERKKECYTAVLRGNLNLAAAKFRHGCAGANFDYLARAPLWEMGLDYKHGTGHGVGYLLNVHEGPNAFRLKEADNSIGTVFEEGMVTSDEPGVYLEGEFGIRLENLLLCKRGKKTEYGQFMEFLTLTLAPFDRSSILPEKMSDAELTLLNEYHKRVYETISPYLEPEEREWLLAETAYLPKTTS